jgi:hypothetical protein
MMGGIVPVARSHRQERMSKNLMKTDLSLKSLIHLLLGEKDESRQTGEIT